MAYQLSGRREEVDGEGKLQPKIDIRQWCMFGKHPNCTSRVQPSACFGFFLVFSTCIRFRVNKEIWNPPKEDWMW